VKTAVHGDSRFRATGGALVRATAQGQLELPPWPTVTETSPDAAAWASWLRRVWAIDVVGEAIGHASPELAKQVQNLCAVEVPGVRETRGAVLSVVRYLMRMAGRPTPNGLFAGVAPVRFAHRIQAQWGDRHQAAARADAGWLDKIIHQLQGRREILRHLLVVANTTLMVRGDRLIVPYQPNTDERGTSAVEVSMRHTAPARAALAAARAPIRFEDLCTKVHMEFPGVPPTRVSVLLTQLVTRRALVTSLHAPSTEPDALGHLLQGLAIAGQATADQAAALKQIHALLQQHQRQPAVVARALRDEAAVRMRGLVRTPRHPVAVDLRLDAHIVLPYAVAREAERAALLLARLSPYPYGTTALGDYHRRFYQRFGTGVQVPLLELVADGGIGWPDGYPGTDPPPRPPRTRRDETLSALAQTAALDGRVEVVLDEELIAELDQAKTGPVRLPSNLELCTRVDATSLDALQRGDFRLIVTSVSRAAGVVTGRFLHLLTAPEREALTGGFVDRPGEDEVLLAQLSFPPLDPATTHVTRTMQILPAVVSLAEHRDPAVARHVLTAGDLAVSCDSHRLYLTAPAVGRRVEAWGMHALNLRTHTPPLARLVAELSRAQCAQVTDFDWGAAATLPFLPRVRCGRVVLAPARWRLAAADLPGRTADWALWDAALAAWQARHRLPLTVYLVDGDWRLPLDLDEPAHRAVLREHLNTRPHAVLDEAPAQDAAGWCAGRAHEVIVPLAAQQPQAVSRLPRPSLQRVVNPGEHGRSPGTSRLLYAQLYGDPQRQDIVLAEHLPALLATWGQPQPPWWFLRFRHAGDHYLRLRIVLPAAEEFGDAVCRVSTWVDGLRRCGLLREVAYATSYPDTGRWGCGTALAAAQAVFTADSRAVVTQLAQPKRPHRLALAAANFAAITTAFTGTPAAGMRWLIEHVAAKPPTPVPRPVYGAAQRLADPREDFHALRQELGSALITSTWTSRAQALAAYRSTVDGPDAHGVDPNAALDSLLHTHFLRAYGVDAEDKAACLYLARAAALAFTAQTGQLP
jgi:thiopeptide-type bacteriocin biosynthesis protein